MAIDRAPVRFSRAASFFSSAGEGRRAMLLSSKVRSPTPRQSCRSTNGRRGPGVRLYSSARFCRPISNKSSKPAVVMKAVRSPFRSSSAFVATVDPCTTSAPTLPAACASPSRMTSAGDLGLDRSLTLVMRPLSSSTTKSVKVPPASTPMRMVKLRFYVTRDCNSPDCNSLR